MTLKPDFPTEQDALLPSWQNRTDQERHSGNDDKLKLEGNGIVHEHSKDSATTSTLTTTIIEPMDIGATTTTDPSTGRLILSLAIPAAAALLIDPVMTVVDTAFVGRFASATADPVAGMGSAGAIMSFALYIFNFLCTATTPLVAQQRAAGEQQRAIDTAGQALSLSLLLGVTITISLWTMRQPLLNIMGTGSTGPTANTYALQFLSVRALAAPAVLCIEASTGVLRGYLDTVTPIYILIVANLINFTLDIIFIVVLQLGPMGAAIATTTAEWISALLFLSVLAGKLPSASGLLGKKAIQIESTSNLTPAKGSINKSKIDAAEAVVVIMPVLSIPAWQQMQPLLQASSAVFMRTVALQLFLVSATAMAARGGGGGDASTLESAATAATAAAATVAAHQIALQLWMLCSFFCDSLAAASQGLVADALGRNNPVLVRDVSQTVFVYSLVLGFILASLLAYVGWYSDLVLTAFTQDEATRMELRTILPLLILSQPLNALVFAADGVLQGASEFVYQAKSMALSSVTAAFMFLFLQHFTFGDAGDGSIDTLLHVWWAILTLQLMRGLTSLWKLINPKGPINLFAR